MYRYILKIIFKAFLINNLSLINVKYVKNKIVLYKAHVNSKTGFHAYKTSDIL